MAGHVERPSVGVAEGDVVGRFDVAQHAEACAIWGDDPQSAWATDVDIAGEIAFDAVDGFVAGFGGEIAEDAAVAEGAVGEDGVGSDGFVLLIPVTDVEYGLLVVEAEAVWTLWTVVRRRKPRASSR